MFFSSNIVENLEGVVCIIFTLLSKHNLFSNSGEFCSSSLAITNFKPKHNEHHSSNPNISKQIVVTDTIVLFLLKSINSFIELTKLPKFLWLILTPLGFPVEPDV